MSNPFDYKVPVVDGLSTDQRKAMVDLCVNGFGFSQWVGRAGQPKPYYFNLDRVLSLGDQTVARAIGDHVAAHLRNIAAIVPGMPNVEPVIAYICPTGAPTGVSQLRAAVAERLGWNSVLVYPDKRLLRSRVIGTDGVEKNFPDSVRWLAGTRCILMADAATTGATIAKASGAISAFQSKPAGALVIYDREEGATESLKTIGLPLYSMFTRADAEVDNRLAKIRSDQVPKKSISDLSGLAGLAA